MQEWNRLINNFAMKDKTNEDSIKADNAVVKAPGMALAGTHDEVIRPGAGKLSQSAATSVGKERCRPLIFIGNDDGFRAGGLAALIDIASRYGDVVAVAPYEHQSGKSSAITVDTPLRVHCIKSSLHTMIYSVNGTPVDCAKLAFDRLLPRTPDLVLSGINHGYNSGNSVIYSGTMGVVFEGSFRGVPSIGFSYGDYMPDADFTPCVPVAEQIIKDALGGGIAKGVCLNVNIPKCDKVAGVKRVRSAVGYWKEEFEERVDPRGRVYYWLTGSYHNEEPDNPETDLYWLDRNYATIVPCRADQTAYDQL